MISEKGDRERLKDKMVEMDKKLKKINELTTENKRKQQIITVKTKEKPNSERGVGVY